MTSEINAVYQSVDLVDGCLELTNKIKGSMYNVAKEFVYIGFLLAECDYFETYKEWGYSSIHEYAAVQLGFKKSSTYNFINVCKAFCNPTKSLPFSCFMKDPYTNFNYSQLVEMLSMNDKQRSQVTSDMTVKQIREVKKLCDDDSRRLESAPEEASLPEVSSFQRQFVSRNVVEDFVVERFFDKLEHDYLNCDDDSVCLFDLAFKAFKEEGYHLYKDFYIWK